MATPEHRLSFADFRERREVTPNVFIGPDARLINQVVLPYNQKTFVPVVGEGIPAFVPSHYRRGRSTRSRLAQIGVEVLDARMIVAEDGTTFVPVVNHSKRDIILPKDMGIYREYAYGKILQGKELTNMLESGLIGIKGEEGREWQLHTRNGVATGIDFSLDSQYRVYLPSDNAPLEFPYNPQNSGGRIDTNTLLEPISPTEENMHWVGQTAAIITLDRSVHGILRQEMTSKNHLYIAPQINSLLAEGRITSWHVRTECIGPTTNDLIAEVVTMEFVAD